MKYVFETSSIEHFGEIETWGHLDGFRFLFARRSAMTRHDTVRIVAESGEQACALLRRVRPESFRSARVMVVESDAGEPIAQHELLWCECGAPIPASEAEYEMNGEVLCRACFDRAVAAGP